MNLVEFGPEIGGDVGAGEGKGDIGGEKPGLGAAIEGAAVETDTAKALRARQPDHGVGDLDFAAGAARLVLQNSERWIDGAIA